MKIVKLCIICIMLLVTASCTSQSNVTEKNYELCEKILNTTDEFLDGNLSSTEALEKINLLQAQLEKDTGEFEKDTKAKLLSSEVSLITNSIISWKSSSTEIKNLEERRNELAEELKK